MEHSSKSRGISVHIGVNRVDPNHYGGWEGPLNACEFDARDMRDIAEAQGFEHTLIETAKATRSAVRSAIDAAAGKLEPEDIFWISYSGHGGWLPDLPPADGSEPEEPDGRDETWCLYDGQLLDDELYQLWAGFKQGVRILVTSDSCHSGTVARAMPPTAVAASLPPGLAAASHAFVVREMPPGVALRTYRRNRGAYERIQREIPPHVEEEVKASVLLIAGCQDFEYSYDGEENGAFTESLLNAWREGRFRGDYRRFHAKIAEGLTRQTPNYFTTGSRSLAFERQRPFTI